MRDRSTKILSRRCQCSALLMRPGISTEFFPKIRTLSLFKVEAQRKQNKSLRKTFLGVTTMHRYRTDENMEYEECFWRSFRENISTGDDFRCFAVCDWLYLPQ